jgi:DNA helicase-2/ATP-dependent DNA helicase PcrA
MKDRLAKEIGENHGVKIMTYHGFCAYFLRLEGDNINIAKDYKILDMTDKKNMLSKIQKEVKGAEKLSFYKLNEMFDVYLHNPMKLEQHSKEHHPSHSIYRVYKMYQEQKQKENSLDFNDLLVLTSETLKENTEIRTR